ncbi:hypothetical protein HJFPF1_00640 [Paramyrothecium foliicola]|nr:hypothetical protein HJFPF1_00640 [Paramyrothecium foliicola]
MPRHEPRNISISSASPTNRPKLQTGLLTNLPRRRPRQIEMDNQGEGKALAWTEEAKFQFLLRIVAQFKEDGKAINWQRVNMPGRTTKSLQNMWTKINKAVADLEEKSANGTPASSPAKTPKKATPRKSAAKKAMQAADDEEDDSLGSNPETPQKTPGKRPAAKGTPRKSKKIKKEVPEDEEVVDEDEPQRNNFKSINAKTEPYEI